MELSTVEIPRWGARTRAADYMRAARRIEDPVVRREYEEIARAYRFAARDDLAVISLTKTIAAGGVVTRTLVEWKGSSSERRTNYLLPRLAACRSSAQFVFTLGIERDGAVRFIDQLNPWHNYRSGRVELEPGSFELSDGYAPGRRISTWDMSAWSALVPIVPPELMPQRSLAACLTLWEAEDWTWRRQPAPPGDPALLQHIGGDLYAVLATWDLTELERCVLSGRPFPEA